MRIQVILLAAALAFAAKPPLTTETVFDWRVPSSPRISPDGGRIVYVLEVPDRFEDTFHSHLWIVSADGKDHRPLTSGKQKDTLPRWSPDGAKLAYVSNRAGKPQIFVRWMDTGVETKLTDLEAAPTAMTWSPDGEQLAFLSRVPDEPAWKIKMPN